MQDAQVVERIQDKFQSLRPVMDECVRRQCVAADAAQLGRGGVSTAARAARLSRTRSRTECVSRSIGSCIRRWKIRGESIGLGEVGSAPLRFIKGCGRLWRDWLTR
jgi:hypothetical protein